MTFSIVARDPETGALGVATATAGPAVGALVPHTRLGIGAVATQAMTNPYLAFDALDHLQSEPAQLALDAALAGDENPDLRQVILVDSTGRTAGWTGRQCMGFAGHAANDGVAVAGNLLTGPVVLDRMVSAFETASGEGLARAMLHALEAGAAAGGDSRGIGSAALRVHTGQRFPDIDLRVDLSDDPLGALDALLSLTAQGPYADFFAKVPRR